MEARTETLGDDVIVVGSGPAGISVSWPLVEAGLRVRMLDGAPEEPPHVPPSGDIGTFRGAPDRWRHQFGADLGGLRVGGDVAPKPATPHARRLLGSFGDFAAVESRGFSPFAGLGAGGLSAIWGALTPRFAERDFTGYPITLADLLPSYDAVGARIGLRAGGTPFREPVAGHLRGMLERYRQAPPEGLLVRPAENAVLGEAMDGRGECIRCGLCLWGCHRGSIYDSATELARLRQRPNFSYQAGTLVRRVQPAAGGHVLLVQGGDGAGMLAAPIVVLAAGTLATTALAFDRLGHLDRPVALLNNPVAAAAFVVPGMIARDLPAESFSLAQLFYEVPLPGGDFATGALYAADALPLDTFARRMPFTRPTALRFARLLAPALVLATCYLPSQYSRNSITVGRRGERPSLAIEGETSAAARSALTAAKRRLDAGLFRLGAWPLPGGFAIAPPGSDAHYAGTVPMLRAGGRPGAPGCGADGEVHGATGLFVADGAALPALPARHSTLTIMANADRIGRALAARPTLRAPGRPC